jgi:inorganic pyrophosphatase
MTPDSLNNIWKMLGLRYKSHPWHGITIGELAPDVVSAFIEIIPTDTVKYEIDKTSGYLKVDRPQKFSNVVPALYGFIPQTYCTDHVSALCLERTGRTGIAGDKDPLDICVLTEREITHGDIIVKAVPIGGFRMIDNNEADDKIIAVLQQDEVYGSWTDISQLPPAVVDRLKHYFLTYKQNPGASTQACEITHTFGRDGAIDVIKASMKDYKEAFGNLEDIMSMTLVEWMNLAMRQQEIMKDL